ncbi:Site-specific DNA-methyltransferase (adenine-specific) [Flagellimonas maritima]|uniref:Site-specific DNA-methyltransferase (Adenine-specific) n=1 Tax=Flagellimonas maritima TaxID=1383885 RepID=A0A2Z4LWT9_9FLAO|nr:adenine-specific methyltransferase EcoRI family protein [Allomuricauda aurantiaca]AWX46176.1 Site-specific DNA-methyltransferase (adenine-specific) [Allomuricauda aurantiaca]
MANSNLTAAKRAKNDEFYTQYHDIEKEINAYLDYSPDVFKGKTILLPCDDPEWSNFTKFFAQNFERFGLKKLISTSYAVDSKLYKGGYQVTMFEESAPQYDSSKTRTKGKIFTLARDISGDGKIDVDDLEWNYLEGDGDFKSDEVKALRNEADIIITNPPFSLFRDFLAWILEADKQFVIIGNMNAITYKEVFPLIKENKMWLGATGNGNDMVFAVPPGTEVDEKDKQKAARLGYVGDYTRLGNSCWFTTIDHGRRHQPMQLMSMADNQRFNKKLKSKSGSFQQYDNYNAIEVPFTDAIPSDFNGAMGVPISFLDKYNPDQFEIVGLTAGRDEFECRPTKRYINPIQHNPNGSTSNGSKANTRSTLRLENIPNAIYYTAENADGPMAIVYARILIQHKNPIK